LQLSLLRPILEEYARMTAAMTVEELRRNPIVKQRWTDTKGAATHCGWTETALAQRKSKGQIPSRCYKKVEKSLRWDLEALDEWLAADDSA
jgi:hypothetical protein